VSQVVVVGGGVAGLAVAIRAARAGHRVDLIEATGKLGGLAPDRWLDGFRFDDGRCDLLLPAAIRDLFHSTGRPLERELELRVIDRPRRWYLPDGPPIDLPLIGRGAQLLAIADRLGQPAARAWTAAADRLADRWEVVRQIVETRPAPPGWRQLGWSDARRLGLGRSASSEAARLTIPSDPVAGRAEVLRDALDWPLLRSGQDPRHAPAVLTVTTYLERELGRWRPIGGPPALVDALRRRLLLRGGTVHTDTRVRALLVTGSRVTGVVTPDGRLPADVVVTALGPPALADLLDTTALPGPRRQARRLRTLRPASDPARTWLGVPAELAPDAYESVLPRRRPAEPTIAVRRTDDPTAAPDGEVTLTVETYGGSRGSSHYRGPGRDSAGDLLDLLADRGLDLRAAVRVRCDEPARLWAAGPLICGARTFGRLAPVAGTVDGLLVVGGSSYLPTGVAGAALSAALAAAELGRVDRVGNRPGAPTTLA